MANSDKNIVITPNTGQAATPTIVFTGGSNTPSTLTINDNGSITYNNLLTTTNLTVSNTITGSVSGSAAQLGGVAASNYFRVDGTYPNTDMNTPVEGYWHVASNATGLPETYYGHRWDYDHLQNGQWVAQFWSPTGGDAGVWFRQRRDFTWQTWRKFLDSSNYNSYAPTLTGTGASGTWNITANYSNNLTQGFNSNWNTDFSSTPAGSMISRGDTSTGASTGGPGGTWWFQQNFRHTNATNVWGVQVAWGWEDNANILRSRNVTGGTYGGWVTYLNSNNYTGYLNNTYMRSVGPVSASNDWNSLGNTYPNTVEQVDPTNFASTTNGPTAASYTYGTLVNLSSQSSSQAQIYISHAGNDLIFRGGWGGASWQTWNKVLTNQNYSSYAFPITGGTLNGSLSLSGAITATGGNNYSYTLHHGNYERLVLPAANNGAGNGEAGLYLWISEPAVTWTAAGIGRNRRNSNTGFPRINTALSANMIRFLENDGLEFSGITSGGTAYTHATMSASNLSVYGDVTAYASDKRLKTNSKTIEHSLEKVLALNGVYFDWVENIEELGFHPKRKHEDAGLFAQDVEKVLPQAIEPAPFDQELDTETQTYKSKSGEDYLTVNYAKLVPLLVNAIKEQQAQINEQAAEIAELKKFLMDKDTSAS